MAGDQEGNSGGVEVGYKMSDETSLQIVAGQYDIGDTKRTSYGGGFAHSLGGGATLKAGIGSYEDADTGDDQIKADFGIAMKF